MLGARKTKGMSSPLPPYLAKITFFHFLLGKIQFFKVSHNFLEHAHTHAHTHKDTKFTANTVHEPLNTYTWANTHTHTPTHPYTHHSHSHHTGCCINKKPQRQAES